MRTRVTFAIIVAAAIILPPTVASADVIVGSNNGNGCFPFGACFEQQAGLEYQQVYTASAFSGPTTIGAISFFDSESGALASGTYQIFFYTTTKSVNGLSANNTTGLSDNPGTQLSDFGTFSLSGPAPATLTLSGTPFVYDPSGGNLLMDVFPTSFTPTSSASAFFETDLSGTSTSRAFFLNDGLVQADQAGLVTEFSAPAATPLPATLPLFVTGLGGLGLLGWRRRTQAI
jgi:hypothetical protein